MKKTKKKPRRGLAPARSEVAAKRATGYLTPATAAARFGISEALVRKWIREWRDLSYVGELPVGKAASGNLGKLATYKDGPNVWVLAEAVRVKVLARRGSPIPTVS